METELDLLIREAKQVKTLGSYLKLHQFYRASHKYFSAQQTLERFLQGLDSGLPVVSEDFAVKLLEILGSHSDIKKTTPIYHPDAFVAYSLLGDISLILKEPLDALVCFVTAVQNYSDLSEIKRKVNANLVFSGLIQCFLSILMQFLYAKDYKNMMTWKAHTSWLISQIKSSADYIFASEKLEMMIGNYYFILFSWYGHNEDFELCESHLSKISNPETRFILSYYRNKAEARLLAKELVMNNPSVSLYWTWLSFVEENYLRKCNAINRALHLDKKNWVAWVALGIIQASNGDFIKAANTWKIAHHVNHLEPKLWLLSAFLYKEAKMEEKSIESFKMAGDLDPSIWISIENYLPGL